MNYIILLFSLVIFLLPAASSLAAGSSEKLTEKLTAQWGRFENAQQTLITRMGDKDLSYSNKSFTRLEWERLYLEEIEKRFGIVIRINPSFQRTESAEILYQQMQEFLKLPQNKFLVGIDFLDNEKGHSALDKGQAIYGSLLAAVKKGESSLRRTMHSGELGDPRNPRDSILLGSERLGHGVLLEQDLVALEYAALKKNPA